MENGTTPICTEGSGGNKRAPSAPNDAKLPSDPRLANDPKFPSDPKANGASSDRIGASPPTDGNTAERLPPNGGPFWMCNEFWSKPVTSVVTTGGVATA